MDDIDSIIAKVNNLKYIPSVCVHKIRPKEQRVCIADIDVDKDQLAFTLSDSKGVYFITWHHLNDDLDTCTGTVHDIWEKYKEVKDQKLKNQKNKISENFIHLKESLNPCCTESSELNVASCKNLLHLSCFDNSEPTYNKANLHFFGGIQDVTGLCFTQGGNLLLSSSANGCVNAYSTFTTSLIKTYTNDGYFAHIDVNPDNTDFVTGGASSLIHGKGIASLFHFDVTRPVTLFEGHEGSIEVCVKYHPNGLYFATTSTDKTIKLWDLRTKKVARNIQHSESGDHPLKLAYSVDGKFLASTCSTHVKIWDLSTCKVLKILSPPDPQPNLSVVCYNNLGNILTACGPETIYFWDLSKEKSSEIEPQLLISRKFEKGIKAVQYKKTFFAVVIG